MPHHTWQEHPKMRIRWKSPTNDYMHSSIRVAASASPKLRPPTIIKPKPAYLLQVNGKTATAVKTKDGELEHSRVPGGGGLGPPNHHHHHHRHSVQEKICFTTFWCRCLVALFILAPIISFLLGAGLIILIKDRLFHPSDFWSENLEPFQDKTFNGIPIQETPLFISEIEENRTFREYHEGIVHLVNNNTHNLWQATLNFQASPIPPDKYRLVEKKEIIRSIHQNWLNTDFLRASLKRQREIYAANLSAIPKSFDARLKWAFCFSVHDIPDQAGCGACWGVSVSSVIADRICIHTKGLHQPRISTQDFIDCCEECHGCKGADTLLEPWMHWLYEGVVTGGGFGSQEGCKPYKYAPVCGQPCPIINYLAANAIAEGQENKACRRQCEEYYTKDYEEDKHYGESVYWIPGTSTMFSVVDKFYRIVMPNASLSKSIPSLGVDYVNVVKLLNDSRVVQLLPNITRTNYLERTPEDYATNEAIIRYEIMTRGPVTACFRVSEDFQHYKSGIYHRITGQDLYEHCARIIGWDETANGDLYWILANSWGRSWGENGYFRVLRGNDEQGIEVDLVAGMPNLKKLLKS